MTNKKNPDLKDILEALRLHETPNSERDWSELRKTIREDNLLPLSQKRRFAPLAFPLSLRPLTLLSVGAVALTLFVVKSEPKESVEVGVADSPTTSRKIIPLPDTKLVAQNSVRETVFNPVHKASPEKLGVTRQPRLRHRTRFHNYRRHNTRSQERKVEILPAITTTLSKNLSEKLKESPCTTPDLSLLTDYADAPLPKREQAEYVVALTIPADSLSETAMDALNAPQKPIHRYIMDRIPMDDQKDGATQSVAYRTEKKEPQPW